MNNMYPMIYLWILVGMILGSLCYTVWLAFRSIDEAVAKHERKKKRKK
jgi:hypothetical protein